ncbi:MAG: hypothetical protein Q8R79_07525 [Legionellaceae bacterium]|nr:hypothetical protein [Legionellaceae bacterium]
MPSFTAENYPGLAQHFEEVPNFPIILQAMEQDFPQLFNLQALEETVTQNTSFINENYFQLFNACVQHLKSDTEYTTEELIPKLAKFLYFPTSGVSSYFRQLYVPDTVSASKRQIGLIEKFVTGSLEADFNDLKKLNTFAFTYLDMWRSARAYGVKVCDYRHLEHVYKSSSTTNTQQASQFSWGLTLSNKEYIFLNCAKDPRDLPQWATLEIKNGNATLYCEAPIRDDIKQHIREVLLAKQAITSADSLKFAGETAAASLSTGITAVTWMNENNGHGGAALTLAADFPALLVEWGWKIGGTFAYPLGGSATFNLCSPAYQRYLHAHQTPPPLWSMSAGWTSVLSNGVLRALPPKKGQAPAFRLLDICGWLEEWSDPRSKNIAATAQKNFHLCFRSYNLSLDWLLEHVPHPSGGKVLIIDKEQQKISLRIPNAKDIQISGASDITFNHQSLASIYNKHRLGGKAAWSFSSIFRNLKRQSSVSLNPADLIKRQSSVPEEIESIASGIIVHTFRACAKQRTLEIDLPPEFKLDDEEQALICFLMENNAFVTELISDNNQSLQAIKTALQPVFARNRWLQRNGYLPPMLDSFWTRAAHFWAVHLCHKPNLLEQNEDQYEFRRCVQEMGIQGLQAFLIYLSQNETFLSKYYGKQYLMYYAAFTPSNIEACVQALQTHIEQGHYFPYTQFCLAFQISHHPEKTRKTFFGLLQTLAQQKIADHAQLDKIYMSDVLKTAEHKIQFKEFLLYLDEQLEQENWTIPFYIPELEDPDKLQAEDRHLWALYKRLNNRIVQNFRKQNQKGLETIITKEAASSEKEEAVLPNKPIQASSSKSAAPLLINALTAKFNKNLQSTALEQWPIDQGNQAELQVQQQQEIKQERQLSRELDSQLHQNHEEELPPLLISYDNIEQHLGKYFEKFKKENPYFENAATLGNASSELQNLFHTWINGEPQVQAKYLIQKMTPEAAKALMRKHRLLTGGLNPNNLPKGFFTQRGAQKELILGYRPEIPYTTQPSPLTLRLEEHIPHASAWAGDFQQFHMDNYTAPIDWDSNTQAWQDLALFTYLQPPVPEDLLNKSYQECYESLSSPALKQKMQQHKTSIQSHWETFYTLWCLQGEDGVRIFTDSCNKKPPRHICSSHQALDQILEAVHPESVQQWAKSVLASDAVGNQKFLIALGQVYFRFGAPGLSKLLTQWQRMSALLGKAQFLTFKRLYLDHCETFLPLTSEDAFDTMEDMVLFFQKNPLAQALWNTILEKHMNSVHWDKLDDLWNGFRYFYDCLAELDLTEDEILEALTLNLQTHPQAQNMLSFLDLVLESLKKLSHTQKSFLKNLSVYNLEQGGAPYAIQHEQYSLIHPALQLEKFKFGSPTYAVSIKTLYDWQGEEGILYLKRALASYAQMSMVEFESVLPLLTYCDDTMKNKIIWLIYTRSEGTNIFEALDSLASSYVSTVAHYLHHSYAILGLPPVHYPFAFLQALEPFAAQWQPLLASYPDAAVLDCLYILYQTKRFNPTEITRVLNLLTQAQTIDNPFKKSGLLLASLYGANNSQLSAFYDHTQTLVLASRNECSILFRQLSSLDYNNSDTDQVLSENTWNLCLETIQKVGAAPLKAGEQRKTLLHALKSKGLRFQTSIAGDYRAVTDADLQHLKQDMEVFTDHQARLKKLFISHIGVPNNPETAPQSLKTILNFFKRLTLNKTFLNETEPLLATIENYLRDLPNTYWSATYFNALLRLLQPKDEQSAFPFTVLQALLEAENSPLKPRTLDEIEIDFPENLKNLLLIITDNTSVFNTSDQTYLARLALREFSSDENVPVFRQIRSQLETPYYDQLRSSILPLLLKASHGSEVQNHWRWYQTLVNTLHESKHPEASKTAKVWLDAILKNPRERGLLEEIFTLPQEIQSTVLYIVAWSSLHPGLTPNKQRQEALSGKKIHKLIARLSQLPEDARQSLLACYPGQPSPNTKDILNLIKASQQSKTSFNTLLNNFKRAPFPETRADYGKLHIARENDFMRMLKETYVTEKTGDSVHKRALKTSEQLQLTFIFQHLKSLENGDETLGDTGKPLKNLNQKELAEAFQALSLQSKKHPHDLFIRAQIWAVLFETLGRTTRKYPHLAQQFALITNDLAINASSSILQLKTGEGKSHFVAMRAARHAGLGKKVEVCTAKWSLAARDLEDYKAFFDYLDLSSSNLAATDNKAVHDNAKIIYTTAGDLSLFLDAQEFNGTPIEIAPENRVGLLDEFDFIYYEGQKTQYNYARFTGITPKEMSWFYKAINAFCGQDEFLQGLKDSNGYITKDMLKACFQHLVQSAGHHPEKLEFLEQFNDPNSLVKWIQSGHEARKLQQGVHYTIRAESVTIGDQSYPLRVVYPLTRDMQIAYGSSFSHGVHQLLAERLNMQAGKQDEPQNYQVLPESHIVSSQIVTQRIKTLWNHWEGFTGTVSTGQAQDLGQTHGTQILHIPTNQKERRFWHKPAFYDNPEARLLDIIEKIKTRLQKKQSILFCGVIDTDIHVYNYLLTQNKEAKALLQKNHKNFAELEILAEKLKDQLSDDEKAQFLFYTNEDPRSPAEILEEKRRLENNAEGEKVRGIVLTASGFGRGDNVEVDAVILCDVNDHNDLLQKGGRTARNGQEGEVLQFYLTDEIGKELAALIQEGAFLVPQHMEHIEKELVKITASPKEAARFEAVLLLREYLYNVKNQATLAYHEGKAELCTFVLHHIGTYDTFQRETACKNFANILQELEKKWVSILASTSKPEERILAIRQAIDTIGDGQLDPVLLNAVKFKLSAHTTPAPILVGPAPTPTATANAERMDQLLRHILNIKDFKKTHNIKAIGEKAEKLLADDYFGPELLLILDGVKEAEKFINIINTLHDNLHSTETLPWVKLRKEAKQHRVTHAHETKATLLKQGIPSDKNLNQYLQQCTPTMQEKVLDYLSGKNEILLDNVERKLTKLLPILQYVSTFDAAIQQQWGKDYVTPSAIETLSTLPESCFTQSALKPIPLETYALLKKYFAPHQQESNAEAYNTAFHALHTAIATHAQVTETYLAKFETQSADLALSLSLMEHIGTLIQRLMPEKKSCLTMLLDKTSLALKIKQSPSAETLLALLVKRGPSLSKETALLEKLLQLSSSKKSFTTTHTIFSKLPTEIVQPLQNMLFVLSQKGEHAETFKKRIDSLYHLHQNMKDQDQYSEWILALQNFPLEKSAPLLDGWEKQHATFSTHPKLFHYYLNSIQQNNFEPDFQLNTMLPLLQRLGETLEENPNLNIQPLLQRLTHYQNDPRKLEILHHLLAQNPKAFTVEIWETALVEHLFALEIEAKESYPLAEKVLQDFYTQRLKQDTPEKMQAAVNADYFNFNDPAQRSKRALWLRFINQGVLVTKSPFVQKPWSEQENLELLEQGLNSYVSFTQHTLKAEKKGAYQVRTFSEKQQQALLQCTEELRWIGQTPDALKTAIQESTSFLDLQKDLQKLQKKYHSSWFKSSRRKNDWRNVQNTLNDALEEAEKHSPLSQRYQTLLRAIDQAKFDLLDSDSLKPSLQDYYKAPSLGGKLGVIFRMLRPLHRKGNSRLYATLNKMQDAVTQAYTKDIHSIQDLQDHQTHCETEITLYSEKFVESFQQKIKHIEFCWQAPTISSFAFRGFFQSKKENKALYAFLRELIIEIQGEKYYEDTLAAVKENMSKELANKQAELQYPQKSFGKTKALTLEVSVYEVILKQKEPVTLTLKTFAPFLQELGPLFSDPEKRAKITRVLQKHNAKLPGELAVLGKEILARDVALQEFKAQKPLF